MSDPHSFEAEANVPNGSGSGPAGRNDPLWDELQQEFADHLASAAEDLQRQGVDADEALRSARAAFGDVPRIMRQCWWIKQGDAVMTRVFLITLLVVVLLGMGLLTYGGWHVQQAMTVRMDHVTEQLASLAESQKVLVERQLKTVPGQLEGFLYLGDPSRPAVNASVTIYRAEGFYPDDIYPARMIASDSSGKFHSGPLQTGQYFVVAPLLNRQGQPTRLGQLIQSRPLEIHEGGEQAQIELDVSAKGALTFVLATDLPDELIIDNAPPGQSVTSKQDSPLKPQAVSVEALLSFDFSGVGRTVPRPPALPLPYEVSWPVVGGEPNGYGLQVIGAERPRLDSFGSFIYAGFSPSKLPQTLQLAPGKYTFSIAYGFRWSIKDPWFTVLNGATSVKVVDGSETVVKLQFPDKSTLIEIARKTPTFRFGGTTKLESTAPHIEIEVQPPDRRLTGGWAISGRRSVESVTGLPGGSKEKALAALGDPVWSEPQ